LSRCGQLGQSQLLTPISLYPDHIFAWNSHRKGRIWCREETVHGGFAKICTLSRPNRPLNPGRSKPPRVRRGLTLRGASRACPHANLHAPSAAPCPHQCHGYKAHPSARPSSPLPPRTTPNPPELTRSSGDLPATRQSRQRATTVAKPFPAHLRSIRALE
jgi:hypothetical protein